MTDAPKPLTAYQQFVKAQRLAGKTIQEIAVMWSQKKEVEGIPSKPKAEKKEGAAAAAGGVKKPKKTQAKAAAAAAAAAASAELASDAMPAGEGKFRRKSKPDNHNPIDQRILQLIRYEKAQRQKSKSKKSAPEATQQ